MEICNHAVYNEDVMTRMFCFQIFKLTKRFGLLNLFWIPLMIASGVSLIIMDILNIFSYLFSLYVGSVLAALGLFFMILVITIRKTAKKNPSIAHFILYDDRLEVSVANTEAESGSTFFYRNLYRVYETKTCFYLFIDKKRAYLIVKEGFSNEKEAISLRERLTSVLGKKYKHYR